MIHLILLCIPRLLIRKVNSSCLKPRILAHSQVTHVKNPSRGEPLQGLPASPSLPLSDTCSRPFMLASQTVCLNSPVCFCLDLEDRPLGISSNKIICLYNPFVIIEVLQRQSFLYVCPTEVELSRRASESSIPVRKDSCHTCKVG